MTTKAELDIIKWKNFIYNFTEKMTGSNVQTHLAFNGGKYNIDDSQYDNFYKMYYSQLINGNDDLYIIEKVQNCKFAYFLDIEIPKGENDITLNIKEVEHIVNLSNIIIKKMFIGEFLTNNVISKRTINKNYVKYHVNFPNLIVTSNIAQIVTKQLLTELDENLRKVVDVSVYRTGLRLFGSKKSKSDSIKEKDNYGDNEYQSVYTLIDKHTKEISFDEFSKLIVRRKNNIKLTELNQEFKQKELQQKETKTKQIKVSGVSNEILKEIQRFLINIKETDIDNKFEKYTFNNIGKIVSTQNSLGVFCYYITLDEHYCPFVNREHKRDSPPIYGELTNSGFSIKCYDSDCLTMKYGHLPLTDFESFVTDYPQLYLSMNTRYYKSEIILTQEIKSLLEDSLSMSHYKIAKVAFNIYKNRFRIDELKNPEWYEFDGSRWKKSYIMNILISEDLPRYYKAIRIKNDTQVNNITDFANNKEILESNVRNELINSLINKLENVSFKKNILIEMHYLFKQLDPKFVLKLDANPYLLGFNNGVYDLEKCIFRKGEMNDYITFSTGYDYIEYDRNCTEVKEIYEFLDKIIPNKQVNEYLLKILGRSLLGIPDEKFYILTGLSGANGKSTLINFLEDTLNDYNTAVDVSLLTNKRGLSGSASPDVIRLRGKRQVSFAEPEYGDTLKVGILKAFSGGDSIICRELYKSPISFKLQASMFLICNDIPVMNTNMDGGTLRRIRIIEFNSKFCDNPKKSNEFPIDPSLKSKTQIWRPYFMSILINWYNIYKNELKNTGRIDTPKEVTQAVDKYKNDNDKFNDFFDECVEEHNTIVNMRDIYRLFSVWWASNNINNYKMPDSKELIRAMKLKYNEDDYTLYKGFRVKININDNDNVVEEIDDLM